MIPLWILPLLNTIDVGEFSYNGQYKIHITGVLVNGEWVINIHVNASPYFAWGCNKYHTRIRGSFKDVVRYELATILNQLSECGVRDKREIVALLKDNLE